MVEEKTPCNKKKRGETCVQEQNTMIKRVKARTMKDDRKHVDVTPQPSTREILRLNADGAHIKKCEVQRTKFRLDKKFHAVRLTSDVHKETLKDCLKENGELAIIWSSTDFQAQVNYKDMISLLHHEMISDSVINSWFSILRQKLPSAESGHRTRVLTSNCWNMIVSPADFSNGTLHELIEKPLGNVGYEDVILFPLLTKAEYETMGNHWTLLKLDLNKGKWEFFNSMRPRRRDSSDVHLSRSLLFVKQVEDKLRKRFSEIYPEHPLVKGPLKSPVSAPCLQQSSGSLDCGVIVCYHIETALCHKESKKGEFSAKAAGEYRAKMVSFFVDPIEIVI
ncbi:hypothetical protein ACS0TY_000555 [Phlomoides rotata]